MLVIEDPITRTTSYTLSSVVYFKPNEIELFSLYNQEQNLNNKLNRELYDARELVNKPWELFKLSFEVFYNKLKNKYYRYKI